jgi:hypothetical protein
VIPDNHDLWKLGKLSLACMANSHIAQD